jgi:UDP-N-acetylmuramyl pentapeptide phosphotransferase/UDP-N-acetylglucosamine-1-phosphate transferase
MWTSGFWHNVSTFLAPFGAAALISAGLITLLRPLLIRYALARPNARSSHHKPTPQGGGIAVISATIIVLSATAILAPVFFPDSFQVAAVFAGVLVLAAIGIVDDIRPLHVLPRLLPQTIAVTITLMSLPPTLHAFSMLPLWLERALMFVGLLWLINLVNFMDGIDWMTVAEIVPITAALTVFGLMDALPREAMFVSLALCGAMIGFAPFNRPVARLFLGDVGSLPIGLLVGWMLILLGGEHLIAALLLPLYYLADATITLMWRLMNGKPLMQAHRNHFYQRAMDNGFSVFQIVARVFSLNIILIGLAVVTLLTSSRLIHLTCLFAGCAFTTYVLATFALKRVVKKNVSG